MKRKTVIEILIFFFIMLFVYAAASKLFDYQKFAVQLGQSPMLTRFSTLLAWLVPLVELVISFMLVFPPSRLIGLFAFEALMVMFTVYIVLASRFSEYVPCSCGGILENMSWNQHLYFNVVFILLAVTAILMYPKKETIKTMI